MANIHAIHSVGDSLTKFLSGAYEGAFGADEQKIPCKFELYSGKELIDVDHTGATMLTLFLFRVTLNEHVRNVRPTPRLRQRPSSGRSGEAISYLPIEGSSPLSVDLHYLMTIWADNALSEQIILTWAMRQLHLYPTLDPSLLTHEADWHDDDIIQVIPADLSTEDLMRIWDALEPSYRLSVPYIARVVRIDANPPESGALPVLDAEFKVSDFRRNGQTTGE